MPIRKNDIIRVKIDDLSSDGQGVARYNTMIIFVKEAAPLDILDVKVLKVKKNYAFAKIENIIEKSSCRILCDCDIYSKCGGCTYRHINYDTELVAKRKRVLDALCRIGGFKNVTVTDIIGADNSDFYRNKAQIPVGIGSNNDIVAGFYANHSHNIIDCAECKLQSKAFDGAVESIKEWMNITNEEPYNELTRTGSIRHIYLRVASKTGDVMVCIVSNKEILKNTNLLVNILKDSLPNLKGVMLNINNKDTNVILGDRYINLYGYDYIIDELCGLKFKISPESFYQVNRDQAEKLYTIAKNYACLSKTDVLLDLYCGTGTIGLTMARDVKELIGVEIVKKAIDNANENAKLNDINNATFVCSDAATAAEKFEKDSKKIDVVILDPPRKGCDESLLKSVIDIGPSRIIYISCDPGTLARDLKILAENYDIKVVTPLDMFPRTAHVECVTQLERLSV